MIFDILDAIPQLWRMVEIKTQEMFERLIRSYCWRLFTGAMDFMVFQDDMAEIFDDQLTKAWNEGADAVGVLPEEMTDEDLYILKQIILDERNYLTGLVNDILELKLNQATHEQYGSKVRSRLDMWANRYADVVNRARIHFGGKIKLKWVLGENEEHCESCSRLAGIVAWANEWDEAELHPQAPPNSALTCGGWRCKCRLEKTTERRTWGVMELLLNQGVRKSIDKDGGHWVTINGDHVYIDKEGNPVNAPYLEKKKSIEDIQNEIATSKTENIIVIDKDGNTVLAVEGSENLTTINKEDIDKLDGATILHNHPTGSAPSIQDVTALNGTGAKELRVVVGDNIYIMHPTEVQKEYNGPITTEWPNSFDVSGYVSKAGSLWNQEVANGHNPGDRGEYILQFVSKKTQGSRGGSFTFTKEPLR